MSIPENLIKHYQDLPSLIVKQSENILALNESLLRNVDDELDELIDEEFSGEITVQELELLKQTYQQILTIAENECGNAA